VNASADAVSAPPVAAVKPAAVVESLPLVAKPKHKMFEDFDRPVTPQELQEADEYLKLGGIRPAKEIDTVQGVHELRKGILEGRVNATEQRKRELGLSSDIRVSTPKKKTKVKTKYTKEQFEKYLETARRLAERRQIADGRRQQKRKKNNE
jgi:hypothetical protein